MKAYTPKVKDDAVKGATGKEWRQWFSILDKAGAKRMRHIDIARFVYEKYLGKTSKHAPDVAKSGGWWSQMVTVEYERARGMRDVNQTPQGFMVAVHKTVEMSVAKLEKEWDRISRSRAVASKKLERLPSKTKRNMLFYKTAVGRLVVSFDERSRGKSRIMVESLKLPSKRAVEENRAFWKKILGDLV